MKIMTEVGDATSGRSIISVRSPDAALVEQPRVILDMGRSACGTAAQSITALT
jgi:hypothetical protein